MNVYVEAQTAINQRRMVEIETQMQQAAAAEQQQSLANKIDTGISADDSLSSAAIPANV